MIFASDLDRTIIYSNKFLMDFSGQISVVETGKYKSYMTEPAAKLLKEIAGLAFFVPCTTRTIEQYMRIDFFQNKVVPKYAIVSNGANIILDGSLDTAYRRNILQMLSNECMAQQDILKEFSKLACNNWAQPMRHADEVFHYCIIDREKAPRQELDSFSNWANEQKWDVSIQGRKLYLMPKIINKWRALSRVSEMIGDKYIVAAGDSLLDLPLIQGADYALSPAHGELYEQFGCSQGHWTFVDQSGLLAGEEILKAVIKHFYSEEGEDESRER